MNIEECKQKLSVGNKLELKINSNQIFPGNRLFKLHDEKGFPVADSLDFLKKQKMVVDWNGFIDSAFDHGWKPDKIYRTIKFACEDARYNKDYFRTNFEYKEIE